eukprot:Em0002g806a
MENTPVAHDNQGELTNLNLRGIALAPRPKTSFTSQKKRRAGRASVPAAAGAGKDVGSDFDSLTSTNKSRHLAVDLRPEGMPLLKARHRPPGTSPADSAVGGIASTVAQKPTAGLPTTTLHDPTYMSEWSTASKRSRHHLASTLLESSPKLTSSSSESSNSEDPSSDSNR